MKDNIDNKKNICNRKVIIELRYEAIASMIDKKGTIVEAIEKANVFSMAQWEIGNEIVIRDNEEKEEATNIVFVSFNRLSFTSFNIDSVDSYYEKFKKIYETVFSVLGSPNIRRIGCRIIGTYKTNSNDFSDILSNMKKQFPSAFLLDQYPVKDLLFHLVYSSGMYKIGPLNTDDLFYEREFKSSKTIKHVGVAIDTDNYLTNETKSINDKHLIRDIYMLSLSVEKDLYTNLTNL